jgi:hypothetical protein
MEIPLKTGGLPKQPAPRPAEPEKPKGPAKPDGEEAAVEYARKHGG